MTDDMMSLRSLLEKNSDADLLREMTRLREARSCLREAGASLRRRQVGG